MSQKNSRCNLLFQAAKNGSERTFYDAVVFHKSRYQSSLYSDLNQCDENGDSPLHVAIKCGHRGLVDYMLKWSKNKIALVESQYCFQDPRTEQGVKGDVNIKLEDIADTMFGISPKVPVLYIMEYHIKPAVDDDFVWLKIVLDCVKVSSINRTEKIVALDLLGATFIFKDTLKTRFCTKNDAITNNDGYNIGIKCWKEALALRHVTDDGEPALPKIPCVLPDICRLILRDNVEFVTSDQLKHLEKQLVHDKSPENGRIYCGKRGLLVVQALLVVQRIFSETANMLYLKFWFEYGYYLYYGRDYIRSFNVFHLILNQIKKFNPTQSSSYECLKLLANSFQYMSECLIKTKEIQLKNSEKEKVKSAHLLTLFKFGVTVTALLCVPNPNGGIVNSRNSQSIRIFCLEDAMVLLVDLFPEFNQQETRQLTEYLTEYAQQKFDQIFYSLLQVVVYHFCKNNHAVNDENYIQVIRLLLTIGHDPNAKT